MGHVYASVDMAPDSIRPAFTLIEVLTAVAILALTASSVLYVVNQNVNSAADSAFRMEAFGLACENMERVLTSPSVTETVDFGTSEIHPNISWRTVVEAFSEPADGGMWLRAVCTAEFADSTGETQKVELVHWLAPLTDQQAAQFMGGDEDESLSAEQVITGNENAAKYAEVGVETIEEWLKNGLALVGEGAFVKYNLDIFIRGKGNPGESERARQVHTLDELTEALKNATESQDTAAPADPPAATGNPPQQRGLGPMMRRGLRNPIGN
jgi:prepilin-type N-terminal cleavage/methylation domain-containing protein